MRDQSLSAVELHDSGDDRGSSFSVPAELFAGGFPVADMHIATIEPGAVRGNHFHATRRELLVVMAADRWSLHWDEGAGTPVQQRSFNGPGAVLVTVPIGMSHAIRNDGAVAMRMLGLTDGPYDADNPDAYSRTVVPVQTP
ncbi:polysaccharide biosynthesis C-terminal domain-containing protein [Streptomyces sp. NPDC001073]